MAETTIAASLRELLRPTIDTPFHIDYEWWERSGLDIGIELRSHLCREHREAFGHAFDAAEKIDWIDQRTGEVQPVNGLQHVLHIHCSRQPDYVHDDLPLIDAVFRVLLAGGNKPLSARELSRLTGRPPEKIVRTLGGRRIYKGIRPAR
ncbi:MAG: hypothetical protein PVI63_09360 [Anaerolineae bacterium]|jgi:hypothetical protein